MKTAVTFRDSSGKGKRRNGAVAEGGREIKRIASLQKLLGRASVLMGADFLYHLYPRLGSFCPQCPQILQGSAQVSFLFWSLPSFPEPHIERVLFPSSPLIPIAPLQGQLQFASYDDLSSSSSRISPYHANLCIHTFPTAHFPLRNLPGTAWWLFVEWISKFLGVRFV